LWGAPVIRPGAGHRSDWPDEAKRHCDLVHCRQRGRDPNLTRSGAVSKPDHPLSNGNIMADIIVIGAGVLGTSVAYRLALA
ncbi:hypothetical protein, partial [Acinetobacter nosocomialis]|uniref:hypothetical protein n=1 Tax=Acinetobacter nosocomialis TaxID=106654 RepID=UPI001C0973C5